MRNVIMERAAQGAVGMPLPLTFQRLRAQVEPDSLWTQNEMHAARCTRVVSRVGAPSPLRVTGTCVQGEPRSTVVVSCEQLQSVHANKHTLWSTTHQGPHASDKGAGRLCSALHKHLKI